MTAYTFDQIIDFTRTSAATYVANTGFVTQTPASRNLLTYTQEFDNAAWTKANAQVVPNVDPATATFGAELVTNGDFSAGATGWTVAPGGTGSITGGQAVITGSGAASNILLRQAVATVAGRLYRITYNVVSTNQNTAAYLGSVLGASIAGTGTRTFYLVAAANNANLEIVCATVNGIVTIDNISVREVIGGLITAPDGTLTGDALVANPGAAVHNVGQNTSVTGAPYTWSVYAKASTSNFMQLVHTANANTYANFNLATGSVGTVGSLATATMTSVGNGWYRCSLTFTPSTGSFMRVAMISSATAAFNESWTATGTESILIWGAQLEAASAASTYTRNVGGVYPPRFDYDPVTLAPRGLLIEEQRTNLVLRSEEFDNASWIKSRSTITANATTSPDGTADADKLVEDTTATSTHRVYQQASKAASSLTRTFSVYLKAAERTFARVQMTDSSETVRASTDVDLSAGTATAAVVAGGSTISAASSSIAPVGNGWYRVSVTATLDASITNPGAFVFVCNALAGVGYTGDGTSGIFVWGAQWEDGAFATSYIPTVASQVTRTADQAAVTGANFSRWYNGVEGTLLIEGSVLSTAGGGQCPTAGFDDGTASNRYIFFKGTGTTALTAYVSATGATGSLMTLTANTPFKAALAFNSTGIAACANGGSVSTASGTATGINRLSMGQNIGGISVLPGHVRRIRYYPTRLSNTQLQALTA